MLRKPLSIEVETKEDNQELPKVSHSPKDDAVKAKEALAAKERAAGELGPKSPGPLLNSPKDAKELALIAKIKQERLQQEQTIDAKRLKNERARTSMLKQEVRWLQSDVKGLQRQLRDALNEIQMHHLMMRMQENTLEMQAKLLDRAGAAILSLQDKNSRLGQMVDSLLESDRSLSPSSPAVAGMFHRSIGVNTSAPVEDLGFSMESPSPRG